MMESLLKSFSQSKFPSKTRLAVAVVQILVAVLLPIGGHCFSIRANSRLSRQRPHQPCLEVLNKGPNDNNDDESSEGGTRTSRYEDDSGAASKGIVSTLTSLVNSISYSLTTRSNVPSAQTAAVAAPPPPPKSPLELMERIRQDYKIKNYLWTGDIDLSCFDSQCQFTDPTLSFTGTDQFAKNIQNLKPLVDLLLQQEQQQGKDDGEQQSSSPRCSSVLLDIQLMEQEGYIQSRWNMIGDLKLLPWKPRIDVIGRTKFWFQEKNKTITTQNQQQQDDVDDDSGNNDDSFYQVVEYDEEWEIPAGKALLQLVTPAGTIPNSSLLT